LTKPTHNNNNNKTKDKLMKRLIFIAILSFFCASSFGQCEEKSTQISSVGRFVQGDSKQGDMLLEAKITIDKEMIILNAIIGGQTMTISNTIKSIEICNWKEYLKTGQSVYKVSTEKGPGVIENSIIKITGKDGKTTIYFGSDPDEKGGLELEISESKIED
jgi:hypothetical protein